MAFCQGVALARRPVAMRAAGVVSYIYGDHLGSTSLTTDASGNNPVRQLYHPYGTVRWSSGALGTDYTFTGQRHDGYTQLVEMGARWYEGRIGRWVSADTIVPSPSNPQSLNRYVYAANNPLAYVDPSGHSPCGMVCPGDTALDPRYRTPPNAHDLTSWLVKQMRAGAASSGVREIHSLNSPRTVAAPGSPTLAGSKIVAYYRFWTLVHDKARYDFKHRIRRSLGESVLLDGEWYEYSVPGNIFYGYVGRAAGFSPEELKLGAGWAEVRDPAHLQRGDPGVIDLGRLGSLYINLQWRSTYFDDPLDAAAVGLGSALYDECGGTLTREALVSLLTDYSELLDPGVPPPVRETSGAWPYRVGQFDFVEGSP